MERVPATDRELNFSTLAGTTPPKAAMLSLEVVALLAATALFVVVLWRALTNHTSASAQARNGGTRSQPDGTLQVDARFEPSSKTKRITDEVGDIPAIKIVVASQTGTAQKIAAQLAQQARSQKLNVRYFIYFFMKSGRGYVVW
jgi:sulfite reductase alpha subunit-like flavoprotein